MIYLIRISVLSCAVPLTFDPVGGFSTQRNRDPTFVRDIYLRDTLAARERKIFSNQIYCAARLKGQVGKKGRIQTLELDMYCVWKDEDGWHPEFELMYLVISVQNASAPSTDGKYCAEMEIITAD